jgi:superfamily II DNA/RNA helicase
MGYNLLAFAATGKGKTLAFGAPALDVAYRAAVNSCDVTGRMVAGKRAGGGRHELLPLSTRPSNVAVLVIVQATKEMVDQTINSDFGRLAKSLNLIITAIRSTHDVRTYRGAHVLVGTPVQLAKMRTSGHLKRVRLVVLDKADMLVDGSMPEVASIVKPGNANHLQVIAVSTSAGDDSTRALMELMTWPPWEIHSTGQRFSTSVEYNLLTAPPRFFHRRSNSCNESPAAVAFWARLAADVTAGRYADELPNRGGLSTLHKLIMFLPTRALCDGVYQRLRLHRRSADTLYILHGSGSEMKSKRSGGYDNFKTAGPGSILIATLVAARGVDAEGVTLVVTGMPYGKSIEDKRNGLLHCANRTGRATAEGTALVVVPEPGRWSRSDHASSALHWLKPVCTHVWSYTDGGELRDARVRPPAAVRAAEAATMPPSPTQTAPQSTTMESERANVFLCDDSADCDDTSPSIPGRPASSCEVCEVCEVCGFYEVCEVGEVCEFCAGAGSVDTVSDDESIDTMPLCDVRREHATTQTAQVTIDASVRNTDEDDSQYVQLAVVHQQSADGLQNQLRKLIAAAPKPDADFRMRLEQGDSLLDTLVQMLDAEWRCIVQICGDRMAAHLMRSQTHKSPVSEYVSCVQTSYVDGAPTELKERRRAINQKAEQIVGAGGTAAAATAVDGSAKSGRRSGPVRAAPTLPPAARQMVPLEWFQCDN